MVTRILRRRPRRRERAEAPTAEAGQVHGGGSAREPDRAPTVATTRVDWADAGVGAGAAGAALAVAIAAARARKEAEARESTTGPDERLRRPA